MLRTSFSSIQDMLEYNQAILSALEMLYEYEADKWNSRNEPHDKMCDPNFNGIHFDEELGLFLIPCWLSCEISYGEDGWTDNDPYVPYTVEIPLRWVEDYLKENYGYDPYSTTSDPTYMKGFVAGMQYREETHRQQMLNLDEKRERDIEETRKYEREYAKLAAAWEGNDRGRGWNG